MSPIVQQNERLIVQVEDVTHDGAGVAKVEGYPLFIQGALPHERVEVHVEKTLKKYGFARLLRILEPAVDRVQPPCHVFPTCGGCQLQHVSYEGQLAHKRKIVRDALDRIAKLPHVPVHPVIGMTDPWRYRNKSQIPFREEEGRIVSGFFKRGTHEIVDTDICLIQSEEADQLMKTLKQVMKRLGVEAYDEITHRGLLRHLIVRKANVTGQIMVVLVTTVKKLPQKEALIDCIRQALPNVTSIMQNINPDKTNVIFGNETICLYGQSVIIDHIGHVQFEISARSFYQVNPLQTEILYEQALRFAQLTGNETVIDAYCGIGTISLFLAQQAKAVYGVEIVPQAIADAKRNATINGIDNVTFEVGAAETVIPEWYKQGKQFDVLVVDPPRKGCDEKLLQTIITYQPSRIIYVSCNPATLARDLRILEDGGYRTQAVQPVDMFPHSGHVECCALLKKI